MRVTTDLTEQCEIMMEFFELSQPGLMKQLRETQRIIDEVNRLIQPPSAEWTTEIWITDNSHEDGADQRPDLQNSYGNLRISQVSGATPDVFNSSTFQNVECPWGVSSVGEHRVCNSAVVGATPTRSNA